MASCQMCLRPRPALHVELHHNVGMLVMRQTHYTRARLCSDCLHDRYRYHLLRNMTLGWWGTISFFMTIVYLIGNTVTYVATLHKLRRAPAPEAAEGAANAASLSPAAPLSPAEARARLEPFEHNVRLRVRAGDALEDIGRDLAELRGVPEEAAMQFVNGVADQLAVTMR